MCDFNNLSSDENGFILRCRQCGYYQLGFGGVLLTLNLEDYDKFCRLIAHISEKEVPADKWSIRQILIPTPYYGVNLLLSKSEVGKLRFLMSGAENEQVAQSLMALFHSV